MPEGWGCALGGLPDLATENAEHMFIQHAPGIMLCVLVKGYVIQCAPGGPVRGDLRFFVWSWSVGAVSSTSFAACSAVALHELLSLPKLQILRYEMGGNSNITAYA